MKKLTFLFLAFIISQSGIAKIWKIGASRSYTKPSAVAALVSNGDTVEIDAAVYANDVAKWTANNLVLKGIGGLAHLKSGGTASGGKAIWVIGGNDCKIEYIEFSECTSVDLNGAGIRQEGKNIMVSHCFFHDNQNGILAGTVNPSNITIEYSEFANNGYGDGQSHNLYINHIDTLTFRYNYSHHAKVGHELKSRANVNFILYNRFSDEAAGDASRSLDLPNGGTCYIIGNVIEQGPLSQNSNIIGYGLEGLTNTSKHEVYAINNTLINNKTTGSFFAFQTGTALFKGYNNILAGSGSFVTGNFPTIIDTSNNRVNTSIASFAFSNPSTYDFHITKSSTSLINMGKNPGSGNGFSLSPVKEYSHPNNVTNRCASGLIDIGAYEYCSTSFITSNYLKKPEIYPNPSRQFITLNLPNKLNTSVEVYSIQGQLIASFDSANALDISKLDIGIYTIVIKQDDSVWTGKFLKN